MSHLILVFFFSILGLWGCRKEADVEAQLAIRRGKSLKDFKNDGGYYLGFCGGRFLCGATLLNARTALTAEHCVPPNRGNTYTLCAGHVSTKKSYKVTARVKKRWNEGDLAILVLTKDIVYSESVYPAHLPEKTDCKPGTPVTAIGRGGNLDNGGRITDSARIGTGKLIRCPSDFVNGRYVCTDPITCGGDSGGPLVTGQGQKAISIGTVSVGTARDCISTSMTGYGSTCANLDNIKANIVGPLPSLTPTTTTTAPKTTQATTTTAPKTTQAPSTSSVSMSPDVQPPSDPPSGKWTDWFSNSGHMLVRHDVLMGLSLLGIFLLVIALICCFWRPVNRSKPTQRSRRRKRQKKRQKKPVKPQAHKHQPAPKRAKQPGHF